MKIAVVLNGAAGTLLGQPVERSVEEVRRLFEAAGHQVAVTAATGPGIVAAVEKAVASDAEVVVVGGGDGTVACAANRLIGTGKALGILPLGTLNLYAKDLGTPLPLEEAVPALGRGEIRDMDVAEVNGRLFLNHSALGLYPLMVQEREETRKRRRLSKWPAMAIAVVKSLYRYPLLTVGLDLGTGPTTLVTPALAVSNNPYDDGFGAFLRRSRLDGGELALYVARHRRPLRMAKLVLAIVLGTWQQDEELEVFRVKEFTVTSRRSRLRIANDGELETMTPPLTYRIRPKALKVLVPATGEAPATPDMTEEERIQEAVGVARTEGT
jgi:diacylglycerol kinase family enzyme